MPLLINLISLFLFTGIIIVLYKSNKKRLNNALIVFFVLVAAKFCFLVFWTLTHSTPFDWNYLQFPDERRYVVNFSFGDPIANSYDLFTYFLRKIGFRAINLKFLNILFTSFAIARILVLTDHLRRKNRFTYYAFIIGGVLHLHIIYYSIFVLKDSLIFYFSVELFIRLIKRSESKSWIGIIIVLLLIISLRKQMILACVIFLFDRNWRLRKPSVLFMIPFAILIVERYGGTFYKYVGYGFNYSLRMEGGRRELIAFARTGILNYFDIYLALIAVNIRRAISMCYHVDITNKCIILLEWLSVLYLAVFKVDYKKLFSLWPILLVPFVYFIAGIMTLYNIRYNIFPYSILMFSLILASCDLSIGKRKFLSYRR